MSGFVNIKTVFNNEGERSLESLAKLYGDKDYLLSVIQSVSSDTLNQQNISGKKILLKPNWVKHSYKPYDDICLRTHDSVVLAVLETVIACKPSSIILGDAPIQGCNWDKTVSKEFAAKVQQLAEQYQVPVTIKDFRRVVFDTSANKVEIERNDISNYLIFDVGKESYLEPVSSTKKNQFRVSQYNPDKFMVTHRPGMHKYCITKEMFDADIVISLPKVKTHQKAGITAALKNIVGLNGDKDFLPHHRIGGTGMGGDSYPGKNWLRYWAEIALDNSNRNKGNFKYWFWLRVSSLLWRLSMPGKYHRSSAAWYGNDTTWRMVMDLNKVVIYGKADGTLSTTPQRLLYSFCDGIIGGQGDGPLYPDPLNLGIVCFTDDSPVTDLCMAVLMGLDIPQIPLLKAAQSFMPNRMVKITLNGKEVTSKELEKYAVSAIPPPGWLNKL